LSTVIFLQAKLSCIRTICPAHLSLVVLIHVTKSASPYRRYSSLYLDLHVAPSQIGPPCYTLHDVLRDSAPSAETLPVLNRLKAKIIRIHSLRLQNILMDNNDTDRPDGELPTLYHFLQTKRRRDERTISHLRDGDGQRRTTKDIARTFIAYLRNTYDHTDGQSKRADFDGSNSQ
jgi:hypothetical protein